MPFHEELLPEAEEGDASTSTSLRRPMNDALQAGAKTFAAPQRDTYSSGHVGNQPFIPASLRRQPSDATVGAASSSAARLAEVRAAEAEEARKAASLAILHGVGLENGGCTAWSNGSLLSSHAEIGAGITPDEVQRLFGPTLGTAHEAIGSRAEHLQQVLPGGTGGTGGDKVMQAALDSGVVVSDPAQKAASGHQGPTACCGALADILQAFGDEETAGLAALRLVLAPKPGDVFAGQHTEEQLAALDSQSTALFGVGYSQHQPAATAGVGTEESKGDGSSSSPSTARPSMPTEAATAIVTSEYVGDAVEIRLPSLDDSGTDNSATDKQAAADAHLAARGDSAAKLLQQSAASKSDDAFSYGVNPTGLLDRT